MKRLACSAVFLLAVATGSARAQVKLEWNFKPGETVLAETEASRKQTVNIKGKLRVQRHEKSSVIAIGLKARMPSAFVLEVKYMSLKFGVIDEPSAAGRKAPMTGEALAGKVVGGLTATITPRGQLQRLEGYEEFIRALAQKNAAQEKPLKTMLAEEAVRADLEDIFGLLPERPVRLGDKWRHQTSEPMPPFGTLQMALEYVVAEEQADTRTLGCAIKVAYQAPRHDGDFLRVVKGGLTKGAGTGTIVFDARAGRPVRGERAIHLRGELVVEAQGKQTPLEFTTDNTWRMRTSVQADAKR